MVGEDLRRWSTRSTLLELDCVVDRDTGDRRQILLAKPGCTPETVWRHTETNGISAIAPSPDGCSQLALTRHRTPPGDRRHLANEWIRGLRTNISSSDAAYPTNTGRAVGSKQAPLTGF